MKLNNPPIRLVLYCLLLSFMASVQTSAIAGWQIMLQLEDSARTGDVTKKSKGAGWAGKGYLDFHNGQGESSLTVYAPRDDIYDLTIRYSCSEPRRLAVYANNDPQVQKTFMGTGSWNSNWQDEIISIALKGGKNTISLKTIGQSGPNLDYIIIRSRPEAVLDLAKRTLEFIEKVSARPKFAERLAHLEEEFYNARKGIERDGVVGRIRSLRRKIILSHPLLDFDKLLINKRPPGSHHMVDQYLGKRSLPGPGLVVLENWKNKPKEKLLLQGKLPHGSVLHPDLSFDGKRVLFSYCDHSVTLDRQNWGWSLSEQNLRRFFIYEIGIDGSNLRQVTGTANDPMFRSGNRRTVLIEDYDPCYLPDGGFAFVSTRCQSFGRCHGSRYVPAFVLYRGNMDGTNIRRISFGEANEWEPSVLHDGRLVYTRWDYINRHDFFYQSLWTIRPDGTGTSHFYGNYTINPCMTSEAQAVPGSRKVITTAMAHHAYTTGSIIMLDPLKGQDGSEPLTRLTPEISFPETEGYPYGCFATPHALSEDLFLAAYCKDKLAPYGNRQRDNAYSIYLVDTLGGRELIYTDANISCFAPIPIRPRVSPPAVPTFLVDNSEAKTGTFFVQDVYESTQPIEPGIIKSLRINKIIVQPTRRKPALSLAGNEILKKIVGTVPVNEDGSVAFEAPSGVPLQLQLLDKNGMAVMTMRSSISLQRGESASCVGCHEQQSYSPLPTMVRKDMQFHKPKPPAGPRYEGGFSFARTVQPVLDRYCIDCHGLGKATEKLSLLGTKDGQFTKSHNALTKVKGMVAIAYRNLETAYSTPKEYYAHAGKLAGMLLDGHKGRVKLDTESFQRIVDWLDLNAQFYGDYSWNRKEDCSISVEGETALRKHIDDLFGDKFAQQPIEALVNVALPNESRILMAPLSRDAGGWGQISQNGWADTDDPGYNKMRELVEATVSYSNIQDENGTCNRKECICGGCWVRDAEKLASHVNK
ncbi:MAG: HzsA-related protein [Planctomycetota bacterium]|jgi:hypothetical protein